MVKIYKTEYENNPDLTLDNLCNKYSIEPTQLGDTSNWKKPETKPKQELIIPAQPNDPASQPDKPNSSIVIEDDEETILSKIREIKLSALEGVKEFFDDNDLTDVSTKEYRDMVAVLKDLEAGEAKNTQGNTYNVMVQNILGKFQDDC